MPEFQFHEVYPLFNADAFRMIGVDVVGEEVCIAAFRVQKKALTKKGGKCPLCGRHVQVYRREIYRKMFKCFEWLIPQYINCNQGWVNLKDGPNFHGGDNAKLCYWHLMVRHPKKRSLYKPTGVAVDFLRGEISIPKYAYVYSGKVLGFSEELVHVTDMGKFDFDLDNISM